MEMPEHTPDWEDGYTTGFADSTRLAADAQRAQGLYAPHITDREALIEQLRREVETQRRKVRAAQASYEECSRLYFALKEGLGE